MKIKKIESATNPIFKMLLSLTKSKGVESQGQCLVSGEKVVRELSQTSPRSAFWIYHTEDHELISSQPLDQLILLPKKLFKELDTIGTDSPLMCLDVPKPSDWKSDQTLTENELLCALGDPNNLGALLRSALAFNIKNIVLLKECCHPFHPKAIKASSGASFYLNFFRGPSIQELAQVKDILALDGAGDPLEKLNVKNKYRLLLGEEGQGIPQNIFTQKVSIPMSDKVESLNATVAASILLYHLK